MNKVILRGNLTRDLEVTEKDKLKIGRFTLAVSRPFKNEKGEYESDFINCVVFNASEYVESNLKKGTNILLEVNIQTSTYEVEGKKKYSTNILVNRIEIITKTTPKKETTEYDNMSIKTITQETIEITDNDLPW